MLSVYIDDSGSPKDSAVFVLAGLLAAPLAWQRLTRRWTAILDSVGLPYFHMTDCTNGGGIFKALEQPIRNRLIVRLINAARREASYRVFTAIVMKDYHAVFGDRKKAAFAYQLAALGCASRVKAIAIERGPAFRVPYVFDQGARGKRSFAEFSKLLGRGGGEMYRMGAISLGDHRMTPPLQAADMHAYEVYRFFTNRLAERPRKPRRSLRELSAIRCGGGYYLDRRKLEMLAEGVERHRREGGEDLIEMPVDHLETAPY